MAGGRGHLTQLPGDLPVPVELCSSRLNGCRQSLVRSLLLLERHLSQCDHQHVCLWVHMAIRPGGHAAVGSCSLQHHSCCVGAGAPASLH